MQRWHRKPVVALDPPITAPVSNSLVPVTSAHRCLAFRSQNTAALLSFVFSRSYIFSGASLKLPDSNFPLYGCDLPQEQNLQISVSNDLLFTQQLVPVPESATLIQSCEPVLAGANCARQREPVGGEGHFLSLRSLLWF